MMILIHRGKQSRTPQKEEEEEGGRAIRLPNGPKKIGKRKRSMEIFPTAKPYLVFFIVDSDFHFKYFLEIVCIKITL